MVSDRSVRKLPNVYDQLLECFFIWSMKHDKKIPKNPLGVFKERFSEFPRAFSERGIKGLTSERQGGKG